MKIDYKKSKRISYERRRIIRKRKIIAAISGVIILAVAIFVGIWFFSTVERKVIIEAGTEELTPELFIKKSDLNGSFVSDMDEIDLSHTGEYEIELEVEGKTRTYKSRLIIEDTIAPAAEAVTPATTPGTPIEAAAFVRNIEDATDVTVSFEETPSFDETGQQDVTVVLEDEGGNITKIDTILTIGYVHTALTLEAGEYDSLEADLFLLDESLQGEFVTDVSEIDLAVVGTHEVVIRTEEEETTCQLDIVDTTAPTAEAVADKMVWQGQTEIAAETFVENIQDASEVTVTFVEGREPDPDTLGEQTVEVLLTDAYDNSTTISCDITVAEDNEPPQILGVQDRIVYVDEKVSYKENITVTDNSNEDIDVEVDTGDMDITEPGDYTITFKAVDPAGNETTATAVYTVIEKPVDAVSEEAVFAEADKIIAQIITDSMSQKEQVTAIYSWCRGNMGYVNDSDKSDWLKEAYRGFTERRGDCFTYFATAKAMLERLEIKNMDVRKTGGGHYWSMVDVGSGWYHLDVTPRKGSGDDFCMVTDSFLKSYSDSHNNSHVWDRDNYPATPTEPIG